MTRHLWRVGLVVALCVLLSGFACNKQSTVSILQSAVASAQAVINIVSPTWDGLPAFNQSAQAAITAVQNWKAGTPSENVQQALTLLMENVGKIPVGPKYQALITVAAAGVQSVIAIVQQQSPPAPGAKLARAVYKSDSAYKSAWNAEVAKHPELAHAKL